MNKKIIFICFSFFIGGCSSINPFSEDEKVKTEQNKTFSYYADKSVTSLEVPPDLTAPGYEKSFRLEKINSGLDMKMVSLSDKDAPLIEDRITTSFEDIKIEKDGSIRWLSVGKDAETIWQLAKEFFKSQGFVIEKENKKTGVFQTNYLENRTRPKLPKSSLNLIKQAIQDFGKSYSLASLDSYRIRIEPVGDNKTDVFLTLSQLKEVISKVEGNIQHTVFEESDKDYSIETEMLYTFMVYLGGDRSAAREKIIASNESKSNKPSIEINDSINGYAKLTFNLNLNETWDNLSWAFDQLRIDVEDKDILEKTFYITEARTADKGIMSSIFGDDAIKKNYQIALKEIPNSKTEVYFNDISELNEKETKQFSYDFFNKVLEQFK